MPITFYTKEDMEAVKHSAMLLAQALCVATGGICVQAPGGIGRGDGEYCDSCTAEPHCPFEFKSYSR